MYGALGNPIFRNKHVKDHIDIITAMACKNSFWSTCFANCNHLARRIWEFAMKHDIWLSVVHVARVKTDLSRENDALKPGECYLK